MVYTEGQENQQMLNGGNFTKNIMSGFVIFAIVLLLVSGEWRKNVLPMALVMGYLVVIAFSNFAHSERFHQPALPFELMFAAYGVSQLQKKHVKWIDYWMVFIFAANIGWAWIKLAGRGVL
jgi:glycerol uptake facilitator-like aquaporin